MGNHRADGAVLQRQAAQLGHARQVHQHVRAHHAKAHHRQQALAAGEHAGIAAQCRQQRDGLLKRGGGAVFQGGQLHAITSA
ncbi:hypothetical protein CF68_06155 [Cupriavidus sp. SK-4]|nr:hypothetical protein CF68_06155 [Cupriavidus sp. SK-4]